MATNINALDRSNQLEFVNNVQEGLEDLLSKLNEINPSNEATDGTRDFSKENKNIYKTARELIRFIADHQNKDDNPELRKYKPNPACCNHNHVGGGHVWNTS